MSAYCRDHLWPQFKKDIRHFYAHVGWDLAQLAIVLAYAAFKLTEKKWGKALILEELGLILATLSVVALFHFFFVSPIRLHKTSLERIASLEKEIASLSSTAPILTANVLEEKGA